MFVLQEAWIKDPNHIPCPLPNFVIGDGDMTCWQQRLHVTQCPLSKASHLCTHSQHQMQSCTGAGTIMQLSDRKWQSDLACLSLGLASMPQVVRYERMSQGRFNTIKQGVSKFVIGEKIIAQGKLTKIGGKFSPSESIL